MTSHQHRPLRPPLRPDGSAEEPSRTLAITYRAGWLVSAAVPALVLGLAFYVFTAARFDLRELLTGHSDHWAAGGALAISALAAGKVTEAAGALG